MISQTSSTFESDLNGFNCSKAGSGNCRTIIFNNETSNILGMLKHLLGKFNRLKDSINSIKYDIDKLENELNCIRSDLENISRDIKDVKNYLLNHIKTSKEYIDKCYDQLRKKNKQWLEAYLSAADFRHATMLPCMFNPARKKLVSEIRFRESYKEKSTSLGRRTLGQTSIPKTR